MLSLEKSYSLIEKLLAFFFSRILLPFPVFNEVAYSKLSQVSRYPASLSRYLVAYRVATGIVRGGRFGA